MKKIIKTMFMALAVILAFAACKSAQQMPADTMQKNVSQEGEKVITLNTKVWGIVEADALNEDGTKIVKKPYVYWTGRGIADNKQAAIELAQSEAYAEISRTVMKAVQDETKRGNVVNNGQVQQALTQYWEQFSTTVLHGCTPFGDAVIEYSPSTKMYSVKAMVAIEGSKYNELLQSSLQVKPNTLTGEDLQEFIEINKNIMEAAKGN